MNKPNKREVEIANNYWNSSAYNPDETVAQALSDYRVELSRQSTPKHRQKRDDVKTQTNVISNGSKWLGESPDSIDILIKMLETHELDIARFGTFGFISFTDSNGYTDRDYHEHSIKILGNFSTVSHVFNIEGLYKDLERVIYAIEDNLKRQSN